MMNHKRLRLTQIALSLSIALAAAPSFAQNTTSAIGGRISASDGKPAGGATVTILHVESGSVSNVTTDAEGRYVARGLRAGGPYTITITKNGVSEKRENVFVEVAETASVDAQLGASMQTVTVAGVAGGRNEKFSKTTMGSGTSISAAELAIQGSISRNLQDYARTDPRVSQTDKDRGEMSVAGQNSRYNSMTIDGVSVSDTFGLESNGSPTAKQPISIEAIQSVQVNVANYDVTQKGYTGGNINAVTKSGTNTVKGSVYYVFRNDSLAGDRYNSTNDSYYAPSAFKETTKGFTLGAPIIKDKLFIFANYEKLESAPSRNAPSFGPIGSDLTNVAISQSAIAAAQNVAKSKYNLDIGGIPSPAPLVVEDKLVKLDWNINDDHRAMLRYSKTDQTEPFSPGFSGTGLSLDSYWYDQKKSVKTLVGQWFADWTPTFSTELKISNRDFDSAPSLHAQMPSMGLQFSGALPAGAPSSLSTGNRFLNFGTEQSRMANVLGTKTMDAYFGANWSHNDHEVKFGADLTRNKIYNLFLQNIYGNYTFRCENTVGSAFTYSFGNIADCSKATAAQVEAAVLENFSRGRFSSYQTQLVNAGLTREDTAAKFTMKNTGVFVQDTWTVSPRLTVTYGVRLDETTVNDRPRANAVVAMPVIAGNAATKTRQTGGFGMDNTLTLDGQKLWQPRAGFNYSFDTERRTQIRGGGGLFQGAAANVWMSNPFANPGVVTTITGCGVTGLKNCNTYDTAGKFSTDINNQPRFGDNNVANVDVLTPGLRQPSVWKANLAFDHELPWYGIVFSAEYLNTKNRDGIYYRNLNIGQATRTGSDGRELYWNDQGFNPACWNSTGGQLSSGVCAGISSRSLSNQNFNNVMAATRTKKGGSSLVTLSLSRPLIAGFGWSASYTYTDAKEVSPLTSSVALTNWRSRSIMNPNEETNANSGYLVKDRVNAVINFRRAFFGTYRTTFGLFYEGRQGKPYSWTVNNDLNGDGQGGNDLMYIPSKKGSGEVVFYGDTATNKGNEDKFWSIVDANRGLRNSAGKVVDRNSSYSPWTNSFDLRVSQEIPSFIKGHKATFTMDVFNVGNLLNKKWGRINEVGYQTDGAQARSFVDYMGLDSQGRYIYRVRDKVEDLEVRQNKGESQWAIQATLKYEF
ncbi:TonB-dependent receptor [Massilia sp. MB5]|uniref:TonB-dependent receptor n=1 Tax=unclassified Massilia TaxID=2609279 RepID=UPI00067CCA53|nr:MULTISPECIES: TonB-dependent receptor [unclassified Massilia]UMR32830.1 TonB-dependent receptor [Massilia sp. MB5]